MILHRLSVGTTPSSRLMPNGAQLIRIDTQLHEADWTAVRRSFTSRTQMRLQKRPPTPGGLLLNGHNIASAGSNGGEQLSKRRLNINIAPTKKEAKKRTA